MASNRDSVTHRLDWPMIGAVAGLLLIGTFTVMSATFSLPTATHVLQRQGLAMVIGGFAFLFGVGFNYQIYQDQSKAAYALALVLLVLVLVFGTKMRGTRGWFHFGFVSFQPSELARLVTLFVVSDYLVKRVGRVDELSTVLGCLGVAAPALALILLQPDLSCTLVLFPTLLFMLFCAGARIGQLAALAGGAALSFILPLFWTWLSLKPERTAAGFLAFVASLATFGLNFWLVVIGLAVALSLIAWFLSNMRYQIPWFYYAAVFLVLAGGLTAGVGAQHALKEYQRKRFISFVSPEADPLGSGYNSRQSVIALGSGGFWGKGMFSGTQGRLGFLPERHTDFVFAVIGEEGGFLGALLTLGLYLFVLWRLVSTARGARDDFGYLLACGLVGLFGCQLLINTGMAVGLLPVAGVPLPLVSYGGSSLVVSLWALGIAQSIYIRRSGVKSGPQLL